MARFRGRSTSSLGRMNPLTQLWPLPLGFIAGIIAVPPIFRWLLLLLASLGKLPRNLGTEAQRPRRVGIALAVIHPVPWLLLFGLVLGVPRVIASPARAKLSESAASDTPSRPTLASRAGSIDCSRAMRTDQPPLAGDGCGLPTTVMSFWLNPSAARTRSAFVMFAPWGSKAWWYSE